MLSVARCHAESFVPQDKLREASGYNGNEALPLRFAQGQSDSQVSC